jgi:hypothetical protein
MLSTFAVLGRPQRGCVSCVLDRQFSLGVTYPTSMRNWLAFAPGLRRVIKSRECWPNTLLVLQTATYSRASLAVASLF